MDPLGLNPVQSGIKAFTVDLCWGVSCTMCLSSPLPSSATHSCGHRWVLATWERYLDEMSPVTTKTIRQAKHTHVHKYDTALHIVGFMISIPKWIIPKTLHCPSLSFVNIDYLTRLSYVFISTCPVNINWNIIVKWKISDLIHLFSRTPNTNG